MPVSNQCKLKFSRSLLTKSKRLSPGTEVTVEQFWDVSSYAWLPNPVQGPPYLFVAVAIRA
jgi:hypothetical protein